MNLETDLLNFLKLSVFWGVWFFVAGIGEDGLLPKRLISVYTNSSPFNPPPFSESKIAWI